MSNSYVIQWKSKVNGRAGRGTKIFDHEEATRLVTELNSEYPDIEHAAVKAQADTPQTSFTASGENMEEPSADTREEPDDMPEPEATRALSE